MSFRNGRAVSANSSLRGVGPIFSRLAPQTILARAIHPSRVEVCAPGAARSVASSGRAGQFKMGAPGDFFRRMVDSRFFHRHHEADFGAKRHWILLGQPRLRWGAYLSGGSAPRRRSAKDWPAARTHAAIPSICRVGRSVSGARTHVPKPSNSIRRNGSRVILSSVSQRVWHHAPIHL